MNWKTAGMLIIIAIVANIWILAGARVAGYDVYVYTWASFGTWLTVCLGTTAIYSDW